MLEAALLGAILYFAVVGTNVCCAVLFGAESVSKFQPDSTEYCIICADVNPVDTHCNACGAGHHWDCWVYNDSHCGRYEWPSTETTLHIPKRVSLPQEV